MEREFKQVSISKDTGIENCAIVAADVGNGCVVGAGPVVVKPIEDFSVVAGNPAIFIVTKANRS